MRKRAAMMHRHLAADMGGMWGMRSVSFDTTGSTDEAVGRCGERDRGLPAFLQGTGMAQVRLWGVGDGAAFWSFSLWSCSRRRRRSTARACLQRRLLSPGRDFSESAGAAFSYACQDGERRRRQRRPRPLKIMRRRPSRRAGALADAHSPPPRLPPSGREEFADWSGFGARCVTEISGKHFQKSLRSRSKEFLKTGMSCRGSHRDISRERDYAERDVTMTPFPGCRRG